MVEKEGSVAIKRFNLPGDKYHVGTNMFNGEALLPSDLSGISEHSEGCGLRSLLGVARTFLPEVSDEHVLHTMYDAGYHVYWGTSNHVLRTALKRYDFEPLPTVGLSTNKICELLQHGYAGPVNFWGPLWEISREPGISNIHLGDRGHVANLVGAESPAKGERAQLLILDSNLGDEDDLAGYWSVEVGVFRTHWTDYEPVHTKDLKVVGLSASEDVIYESPEVEWKRQQGFLVRRPVIKPVSVNVR